MQTSIKTQELYNKERPLLLLVIKVEYTKEKKYSLQENTPEWQEMKARETQSGEEFGEANKDKNEGDNKREEREEIKLRAERGQRKYEMVI